MKKWWEKFKPIILGISTLTGLGFIAYGAFFNYELEEIVSNALIL